MEWLIDKHTKEELQARIKELEEALRFYAEGKHNKTIFHTEYLDTETVIENGATARKALEERGIKK